MKVALISCTSSKKDYPCSAKEMYSESPRFALCYEYAKKTCDKIYILSAKHGLISEDSVIEPYNETLNEKSVEERKKWALDVINKLGNLFSLERDEFTILAGVVYRENLISNIKNYNLPLEGKSLGNWIPTLKELIQGLDISDKDTKLEYILHRIFNNMPRMQWNNAKELDFNNGIYIMFENGETYQGMDRIVRVGTHRADGRLITRLNNHFTGNNADSSIFRKNIGRALLNRDNSSYRDIWELNTSKAEIKELYKDKIDLDFEEELEENITRYLKDNITFVCFKVDTEEERLRLEEGIISTLSKSNIESSKNWLGLSHTKKEVVGSRLWNIQGVNGNILTVDELTRICELCNNNYNIQYKEEIHSGYKQCSISSEEKISIIENKVSINDIRFFIRGMIYNAKVSGLEYIDIVSGDVHKAMRLSSKMPSVCRAMYDIKEYKHEILHTVPSGKSSTIKIRYYL